MTSESSCHHVPFTYANSCACGRLLRQAQHSHRVSLLKKTRTPRDNAYTPVALCRKTMQQQSHSGKNILLSQSPLQSEVFWRGQALCPPCERPYQGALSQIRDHPLVPGTPQNRGLKMGSQLGLPISDWSHGHLLARKPVPVAKPSGVSSSPGTNQ